MTYDSSFSAHLRNKLLLLVATSSTVVLSTACGGNDESDRPDSNSIETRGPIVPIFGEKTPSILSPNATCRTEGKIETIGESTTVSGTLTQVFAPPETEADARSKCPSSCQVYSNKNSVGSLYWFCECGGPFCTEKNAKSALETTFPDYQKARCGQDLSVREWKASDRDPDKKTGWYVEDDRCVEGRPLLHHDHPLLAQAVSRADWT